MTTIPHTIAALLTGRCTPRRREFSGVFIPFYQERIDDLVLSYYPAGYGPSLAVGCLDRPPAESRQAEIEAAIMENAGVSAVVRGERVGRPGGYVVVEWFWKSKEVTT